MSDTETHPHLDTFLDAYIVCALWSTNDESTPDGGYPLDKHYSIHDLSPETRAEMRRDCEKFLRTFGDDLEMVTELRGDGQWSVWELAGHDFWLTRNGHGAGFWDGGWPKDFGELLTKSANGYGEVYLYVEGGVIYL